MNGPVIYSYRNDPAVRSRVLRIAPRGFRVSVHDPIARHRHFWFGRRDSCRVPTAEEASRFL